MTAGDGSADAARPPVPTAVARSVRSAPRRAVGRAPLTAGFVAVLLAVALLFGTAGADPDGRSRPASAGTGVAALAGGQWWTVVTYGFLNVGPSALILTVLLALAVLGPAERRLGVPATAGLFLLCQVGGALLGVALLELGTLGGDAWLESDRGDRAVGASVGLVGVALALSARLSALWRRRIRLLLGSGVVLFVLYDGTALDVLRCGGAVIGCVTGLLVWGGRRTRADRVASHAENRLLVAIAVGASALGPLIAFLTKAPYGPLSLYSDLFVGTGTGIEDVRNTCAGAADMSGGCLQARSEHLLAGGPAVLMLFVPAILLLIVAEGLRRGRRFALVAAIVVEAAVTLVTWRYTVRVLDGLDRSQPGYADDHAFVVRYSALLMAVPVAVIALLLHKRRHFELRAPRRTALKLFGTSGLAFLVVGVAYVAFGATVREDFTPAPDLGALAADFTKRLVPPVYLGVFDAPPARFIPRGGVAKTLYTWAGPVFWGVALGGLLLVFRRSTVRSHTGTRSEARALLRTYGGSTLSYITTWPGHQYWIAPDARSAVAFRVIGKVALTTGDPFGDPEARARGVAEFAKYCDRQGWSPCFYSVTADAMNAAVRLGWSGAQVAEDTVLPLPGLAFSGKRWQDVRTALNKAGRLGITAVWCSFPTAPPALREQVRELSHQWVLGKGLPEMGFTLGGLAELDDPDVRCLLAVDAEGRVHGITSWLPCYREGEPVGWTLDFMRRGSDGFRGVMEFLIATAASRFQEEGAEFLSLSGAPLARVDRGPDPDGLQRLLDLVGRTLEPVYGFRSLLAFKAKFQPQYHPLYIAYPDPAALPAITNAISRAYLPRTSPAQLLRLSRRLVGRGPAERTSARQLP
ncbi:rhomboid family intramembrane serine protease [Catenulispora subtropica]|uniref:DUF2156 domain-containing protein n=1 Tax=Catenulispora subtropica TaxID=450798 RepID=A0ABN2R6F9_9ACTN